MSEHFFKKVSFSYQWLLVFSVISLLDLVYNKMTLDIDLSFCQQQSHSELCTASLPHKYSDNFVFLCGEIYNITKAFVFNIKNIVNHWFLPDGNQVSVMKWCAKQSGVGVLYFRTFEVAKLNYCLWQQFRPHRCKYIFK